MLKGNPTLVNSLFRSRKIRGTEWRNFEMNRTNQYSYANLKSAILSQDSDVYNSHGQLSSLSGKKKKFFCLWDTPQKIFL